ncbi:Scr1 family TA system antitoxin-like transcriptional regulator [Streptomyces gamaensis]|uniref:Scr1 family TA system antitoxin-like transcriptional regulator n=1 Tax=Streptomyces gamaensis TaxID=1763542 RepID=A0ABW0Z6S8_9ACTN
MPAVEPVDAYQRRKAELGAAIKERREAKRWTQAMLGKAIAVDHTYIAHFEKGRHVPRRDTARRIDKALEAGGVIFKLRDELDDNPDSPRWQRFLRSQSRASAICHVTNIVPAVLETPEHTRAALEHGLQFYGGSLEDKITYRAELRRTLRSPDPPHFGCILWESALQVVTGSSQVMREQLLHLIDRSHEAHVDLRILRFADSAGLVDTGTVVVWTRSNGTKQAWRDEAGSPGVFISDKRRVSNLALFYDQLRFHALGQEESRAFIRKTVEDLYPCRPNTLTCP